MNQEGKSMEWKSGDGWTARPANYANGKYLVQILALILTFIITSFGCYSNAPPIITDTHIEIGCHETVALVVERCTGRIGPWPTASWHQTQCETRVWKLNGKE